MSTPMTITLTCDDGEALYFRGDLLIYFYPAGDCDLCPWPMTHAKHRERLASALYDAVQCRDDFPDGATVLLPDGSLFGRREGVHFMPLPTFATRELHIELLNAGYSHAFVPAHWEERGGPESGPLGLDGGPAFDEYTGPDEIVVVAEDGRIERLPRDPWDRESGEGGAA